MDFWQVHGWLFLLGAAFVPRLTMLFAVSVPFGWLAWLGWAFAPHLTIAVLATTYYWDTNPVLCVIAWMFAFAGTGGEAKCASIARHRPSRNRPRVELA